jgi:hypothetical protein
MKNLIFILPLFLVAANTINRLQILTPDAEWQVLFISEKIATLMIIISALSAVKGRLRTGFWFVLIIYSFETFNEIIGKNVKGTTLSEMYYYSLLAGAIYLTYYYVKYRWIKKQFQ